MAEDTTDKSDYAAGRKALERFGISRIRVPGDWVVESISTESAFTRYSQGIKAVQKGRLSEALVKLVQSAKMYTNCVLSPMMMPEMRFKVLGDARNSYLVAQGIASELELEKVEEDIRLESGMLKKHLYEYPDSLSSPEIEVHLKERHLREPPRVLRKQHDARKKVVSCKRRTSRL